MWNPGLLENGRTGQIMHLAIIRVSTSMCVSLCSNNAKPEVAPKQRLVYDLHANSNILFSVTFLGSNSYQGVFGNNKHG